MAFAFTYLYNALVLISTFLEYAPLKPKKREGKENMSDALFLAKKKRCDQRACVCLSLLSISCRSPSDAVHSHCTPLAL